MCDNITLTPGRGSAPAWQRGCRWHGCRQGCGYRQEGCSPASTAAPVRPRLSQLLHWEKPPPYKELPGSKGLAFAGFQPCTVVLPPSKKRFCLVLFPSPKQETERGFSSRSAPSIASHPRGRCPCLGITSGTPLLPSHAPVRPVQPAKCRAKAAGSSHLLLPPVLTSLSRACGVIGGSYKEEEIFQQCLCSFRDGLKLQ